MIKRIQWPRYLTALLLLGLVVLLGLIGVNKTLNDPTAGPPKGTYEGVGELVATSRACQTFVAQYDGLTRVEAKLDDMGRRNKGSFTFTLRTAPDAEDDIVSLTYDASTVRGTVYHAFAFAPIGDSAGQTYTFCLEAPQAELVSSITVIGTLEDTYPEGKALFRDMWGQKAGVQDLDFHLGYQLSLWGKLTVLADRLAANKPTLCGSPWFYAFLGVAYLALLYATLVRSVPPRED
jgi:hypothetical protein